MNDEDTLLQDLAVQIQSSPDRRSPQTRRQINRLLSILSSTRLFKAKVARLQNQWSGIKDIRSIVAEAVNQRLVEVAKTIDRYNPEFSFVSWACKFLDKRVQDLIKRYRLHNDTVSIDDPDDNIRLEMELAIGQNSSTGDADDCTKLRKLIEEDPDGLLSARHIRNCPAATLKAILLMRLDGWGWQQIAANFGIRSHSTISSFTDRELRKLRDYFHEKLDE